MIIGSSSHFNGGHSNKLSRQLFQGSFKLSGSCFVTLTLFLSFIAKTKNKAKTKTKKFDIKDFISNCHIFYRGSCLLKCTEDKIRTMPKTFLIKQKL